MKTTTLKNNLTIPVLGFGTWKLQGEDCKKGVLHALATGYRHIDTADVYENHAEVGEAIKESSVPREELFITSKIWTEDFHAKNVVPTCKRLLEELQLEYLDLLLMHWPQRSIPFAETLGEMKKLQDEGLIRSIGVSNFTINHLKDALASGVEFVNNQVEFHPSLNQKELKAFCDENNIALTAYCPLGQAEDIKLPVIQAIAEEYGKTPAQIILNWICAKGIIAIPKSATLARIEENFESLNFELKDEDIARIDAIGGENRLCVPAFADFDY